MKNKTTQVYEISDTYAETMQQECVWVEPKRSPHPTWYWFMIWLNNDCVQENNVYENAGSGKVFGHKI